MFRFLLAPLCVAIAVPAAADELGLDQISGYLNSFRTAKGDFTQINDDGSISTGRIWLKRPGRARFEYGAPNPALVMAGQSAVAIFDPKSNTGPESYPLNQTPLSIILRNDVDLAGSDMVTGKVYDGTATTVTAMDPENPDYGNIQLVFTDNPVQLRQWVINDQSGGSTTVILGQMEFDLSLRDRLFDIRAETEARQGNAGR
ncbi:outer membrane lipoprotein carrier protein LolA [Thalassovita sp.]|uniref:LolA family protein n=1 Tax=Thalassovita sp. TaxID=1979401 RepID=UPI0029DE878D|nr:outer membrane lipoprotein carrier protein LolA [Thalassovita sp.]